MVTSVAFTGPWSSGSHAGRRRSASPYRLLILPVVVALGLATAAPAAAVEEWALSAGAFDVGRSSEAVEVGVEGRFRLFPVDLGAFELPVEPALGVMGNGDGAAYGYVSFRVPLSEVWRGRGEAWPERLRVVPYTGVGLYSEGDSKDLGGAVEFRSGLEVAWRVAEEWWLGLSFYHLSNAGIYRPNPGEESLVLVVSRR